MPRVKHAVFMRFRKDISPAQADEVFAAIAELKHQVPGIVDYSGGRGCSIEGLERGHTHAFVTTFESIAARDAYLPHPAHEVVKSKILAVLEGGVEGVTVMDWEERE